MSMTLILKAGTVPSQGSRLLLEKARGCKNPDLVPNFGEGVDL